MAATTTHFQATLAPCGRMQEGDQLVIEDQEGLVTKEITFSCGCRSTLEEFHDGSYHRMLVDHLGKVRLDEELRGG